jgi:hypothetical protein
MSSRPSRSVGTPNGHASVQFPQPMQRSAAAESTTPSGSTLIASAGQTLAHAGSAQCMQTVGAVCTDSAGARWSRWIIACPPWPGHSLHACSQARQPMQRFGSMKSS